MIKKLLRPLYIYYKRKKELAQFKSAVAQTDIIKISIGSSGICQDGWILTEEHFLNLLNSEDWKKHFNTRLISNIVAEHVWEHLTLENGRIAACNCHQFLKPGGKLRIAVPDGFHSSPEYIDYVKPGGTGGGADDHKVLYNYISMSKMLTEAGFRVELLEYFDEKGNFHKIDWDANDGFIRRSIKHDPRNKDQQPNYTSLIVDAIKP
jgi:predicted SAM-dependent methyltransferase